MFEMPSNDRMTYYLAIEQDNETKGWDYSLIFVNSRKVEEEGYPSIDDFDASFYGVVSIE